MSPDRPGRLRRARPDDAEALLALWELLFADDGPVGTGWQAAALAWFAARVDDGAGTRIAVIETAGEVVAAAIGTVEIGVPNPHSPQGRLVRLANVITLPAHRVRGHGTALVRDVVTWAGEVVDADRVDLSATPDGRRLYERLGFGLTSAPRMKLVLRASR